MQGIAELIEEFCECTEGYYFRPDYSGRLCMEGSVLAL